MTASGEGFAVSLGSRSSDGKPQGTPGDSALVLALGGELRLEASDGFWPGSVLGVYTGTGAPSQQSTWFARLIRSTPLTLLGEVTVGESGGFRGPVRVPEDLPPGPRFIQIVGYDEEGQLLSVSLGVKVAESRQPSSILITGQRSKGKPAVVTVRGQYSQPQKVRVRAWVKVGTGKEFTASGRSLVSSPQGKFTWSYRSKARIQIYFTSGQTKSNVLTLRAVPKR